MAMTEHEGLQIYKDASGNSFILYPITKAHLVDGFEEAVMALAGVADGLAKFAHDHAAGDISSGELDVARLPVAPISKGGTGANTAAAALEALGVPTAISAAIAASGAAKFQVCSYAGTGVYGASTPNSVTFNFEPLILFIFNGSGPAYDVYNISELKKDNTYRTGYFFYDTSRMNYFYSKKSTDGKTLSWYCTQKPADYQFNSSGFTYYVIAIG